MAKNIYNKNCQTCNNMGWVEEICYYCNGSGEGHYDGSTCYYCNGKGTEKFPCHDCEAGREIQENTNKGDY